MREALGHLGLVLRQQRLCEEPDSSHRRLQLVAYVRNEIAPDILEAPPFGHIVDDRDHPESALAVVDALGTHDKGATGRPVKLKQTLLAGARRGCGQELLDRLGGDRVAVATPDEGDRFAVAEHGVTALVGDQHSLGKGVQCAAQSDGLRGGLGHSLGGAVGGSLDVHEHVLEVLHLLRWHVRPEAGREGLQPLAQAAASPARCERRSRDQDDHDYDRYDEL